MRIIKTRARNFKGIMYRVMMGLIFFSMIVGIWGVTAFGEDHRGYDRDRYDRGHIERRGPDRYYYEHGRRVYRPYYGYGYRAPVYAPPPVIYAPPPSGISIFFPPIIIR